jgi:hypothetical protein
VVAVWPAGGVARRGVQFGLRASPAPSPTSWSSARLAAMRRAMPVAASPAGHNPQPWLCHRGLTAAATAPSSKTVCCPAAAQTPGCTSSRTHAHLAHDGRARAFSRSILLRA